MSWGRLFGGAKVVASQVGGAGGQQGGWAGREVDGKVMSSGLGGVGNKTIGLSQFAQDH